MAVKHIIDAEVVTQDGTVQDRLVITKQEESVNQEQSADDAVKTEGKCCVKAENSNISLIFNRSEMLRILRFMEG